MYYESDITGDKITFIAQKAIEWMKVNYMNESEKFRDNSYCFVEFDHVYDDGYSHSQLCNLKTKYLVLVTRIGTINEHFKVVEIDGTSFSF